ncbi:unnamed protein product [Acanthosepion pharaonis]|uniref:Uncharacterized protein n=1 Tax=Acanthosepion pharaonis TaxID=158019 RepID=A0A812EJM4_ACAPH|nr:unnamed protein product [Sepia pharaonis]
MISIFLHFLSISFSSSFSFTSSVFLSRYFFTLAFFFSLSVLRSQYFFHIFLLFSVPSHHSLFFPLCSFLLNLFPDLNCFLFILHPTTHFLLFCPFLFNPFLKIYSLLCNLSFTYPLFSAFLTLLSYLVIFKPLSISPSFQNYLLSPILSFPFKASSVHRLPLLTKSLSFSSSFFFFFFFVVYFPGVLFFSFKVFLIVQYCFLKKSQRKG